MPEPPRVKSALYDALLFGTTRYLPPVERRAYAFASAGCNIPASVTSGLGRPRLGRPGSGMPVGHADVRRDRVLDTCWDTEGRWRPGRASSNFSRAYVRRISGAGIFNVGKIAITP